MDRPTGRVYTSENRWAGRHRWVGLLILCTLLSCEKTTAAVAVPPPHAAPVPLDMPGPGRNRGDLMATRNAECEACHPVEAAEWRASLHKRADTEPTYRRAFDIEPLPFCRSCHAPEADPNEPESTQLAALGVGCVTCHITNGEILAAPWTQSYPPPPAPHAVAREPQFTTASACANCHEFGFPGTRGMEMHEKMQATITENALLSTPARPCAECHMSAGTRGQKSHTFSASRDPVAMARAVIVEAERVSMSTVHIRLIPGEVGHAFPTGDLFRRVEVAVEVEGPDHMSLNSEYRYLTRHFEPRRHGAGRQLVRDDRILGKAVTLTFNLGEAAEGRSITYRVSYQRVEHPNGVDESDAVVDGELVLAHGRLL
ncbi:MAG: hypothetical protein IPK82_35380 [Polyangiaceae bacterium]|nr:hypothetical protein [Polyangiaceae bacterium]